MLKGSPTFSLVLHCGRILETPVDPLRIAWEHGTALGGAIADGDDVVEVLIKKAMRDFG
jgi:hypothetical protein